MLVFADIENLTILEIFVNSGNLSIEGKLLHPDDDTLFTSNGTLVVCDHVEPVYDTLFKLYLATAFWYCSVTL